MPTAESTTMDGLLPTIESTSLDGLLPTAESTTMEGLLPTVESSSTAALFSVELTNGLLSESDLVDMNENLSINVPTVHLPSVVQMDDMNLLVDASTQTELSIVIDNYYYFIVFVI